MATPMRLEVETGVIVRLRGRVTTWGGGWLAFGRSDEEKGNGYIGSDRPNGYGGSKAVVIMWHLGAQAQRRRGLDNWPVQVFLRCETVAAERSLERSLFGVCNTVHGHMHTGQMSCRVVYEHTKYGVSNPFPVQIT
jgi:hypothetical protein